MVAPIIGGWVIMVADWRVIYEVQAGLAVLILLASVFLFGETLPSKIGLASILLPSFRTTMTY